MRRRVTPTIALLTVAAIVLLGAACGSSKSSSQKATSTTTTASATAMTDQVKVWFNAADTNHDGRIDPSEADAVITADFNDMDLNNDGVITMDDIAVDTAQMKGVPAPPGPIGAEIPADKDNNGRIELTEYKQYALQESAPLDPAKNGGVTLDDAIRVRAPGQAPASATTATTSDVLGMSGGAWAWVVLAGIGYGLLRRPRIMAPAVLVIALIAGPLASAPALASAVYNQTGSSSSYSIDFTCGIFCGNHWDIPNGQGRARPGKAGQYTVAQVCENTGADGQGNTTDHGWSVLAASDKGGTGLQWTDYGNHGNRTGGANPVIKGTCVAAH